jgi:hypothetical protein
MSHGRNDSLESTASIISCSSEASVEFYERKLKPIIDTVRNSQKSLQELVDTAEKIINEKFAHNSQSTFKYKKGSVGTSVQLDKVMLAMLACAEECGGESGKRYVASAIYACSEEEGMVGALAALGTTWLTHLLFISSCESYYLLINKFSYFPQLKRAGATQTSPINNLLDWPPQLSTKRQRAFWMK